MQGPLGQYGIARSLVQTPGWNKLEAEENEMLPDVGGGGGFGMRFGGGPQQRPYNDMERTILAHDYPGGYKVATDQYAAKYSDQLDEWALAELKYKFPEGPPSGTTWEEEFARQAAAKKLGEPWGVEKHLQKKISLGKDSGALRLQNARKNAGPLAGVVDRDRSGLNVFNRARQNRKAIARRPKTQAAAYSNFGRVR